MLSKYEIYFETSWCLHLLNMYLDLSREEEHEHERLLHYLSHTQVSAIRMKAVFNTPNDGIVHAD